LRGLVRLKSLKKKRKMADKRKAALELRNTEKTATCKHTDDDLGAELLEREQEKLRKQEKDI